MGNGARHLIRLIMDVQPAAEANLMPVLLMAPSDWMTGDAFK